MTLPVFPVVLPDSPQSPDELLSWAGRLTVAIKELAERDSGRKAKALTAAASVSIYPEDADVFTLSAGMDITLALLAARTVKRLTFIITNDSTPRNITFGTGFVSAGVLTGTANKTAVVEFEGTGSAFYETSRKTGL